MKTKTIILIGGAAAAAFLFARSRGINLADTCGWKKLIGMGGSCCAGCAGATAGAAAGGTSSSTPLSSANGNGVADILPDVSPATASGFGGLYAGAGTLS